MRIYDGIPQHAPSAKVLKILVGEYDEDVRDLIHDGLHEVLENRSCSEVRAAVQVITAKTPQEIMRVLKVEKPEWLLFSIEFGSMMPVGLDLLSLVRIFSPSTKVVALTTDVEPSTAELARTFGAEECIVKPFDFDKFKELLVTIVNSTCI